MKRFLLPLSIASSLFATSPGSAQTTPTDQFTAVDSVSVQSSQITINGVLLGEAAASTHHYALESISNPAMTAALAQCCVRLATIAMEKPGAYQFQVAVQSYGYPTCQLSRVTP